MSTKSGRVSAKDDVDIDQPQVGCSQVWTSQGRFRPNGGCARPNSCWFHQTQVEFVQSKVGRCFRGSLGPPRGRFRSAILLVLPLQPSQPWQRSGKPSHGCGSVAVDVGVRVSLASCAIRALGGGARLVAALPRVHRSSFPSAAPLRFRSRMRPRRVGSALGCCEFQQEVVVDSARATPRRAHSSTPLWRPQRRWTHRPARKRRRSPPSHSSLAASASLSVPPSP